MAGLTWLVPLRAYAGDRDPAEIGHAIWFVGTFSVFFIGAMSLAIWLLVVRLRSGPEAAPEVAPSYPSLESVWSRDAAAQSATPPVSPVPEKSAQDA